MPIQFWDLFNSEAAFVHRPIFLAKDIQVRV